MSSTVLQCFLNFIGNSHLFSFCRTSNKSFHFYFKHNFLPSQEPLYPHLIIFNIELTSLTIKKISSSVMIFQSTFSERKILRMNSLSEICTVLLFGKLYSAFYSFTWETTRNHLTHLTLTCFQYFFICII